MINTTSRNPSILWIGEHSAETREAVHRARGQRPVVLYGKGLEILARLGIDNAEAVKTEPIEKIRGPWDKRGFQSYQHHPIFNGLHGGFYSVLLDVLDPPYGEVSLYCGKNAKVIAVEKRFIDYVRSRALIWEYRLKKSSVSGVSSTRKREGITHTKRWWKDFARISKTTCFARLRKSTRVGPRSPMVFLKKRPLIKNWL